MYIGQGNRTYNGRSAQTQNVFADGLSRIPKQDLNLQELRNEVFENDEVYGPEIINKYKNQLLIKISGQTRHVFYEKEYSEEDLLKMLKTYLDPGAVNGIFAPLEVVKSCKKLIEKHPFCVRCCRC